MLFKTRLWKHSRLKEVEEEMEPMMKICWEGEAK